MNSHKISKILLYIYIYIDKCRFLELEENNNEEEKNNTVGNTLSNSNS